MSLRRNWRGRSAGEGVRRAARRAGGATLEHTQGRQPDIVRRLCLAPATFSARRRRGDKGGCRRPQALGLTAAPWPPPQQTAAAVRGSPTACACGSRAACPHTPSKHQGAPATGCPLYGGGAGGGCTKAGWAGNPRQVAGAATWPAGRPNWGVLAALHVGCNQVPSKTAARLPYRPASGLKGQDAAPTPEGQATAQTPRGRHPPHVGGSAPTPQTCAAPT